jgi:hypothetical protein
MSGAGPHRSGRYRLRTWLRGHEPNWLYRVWAIPKGQGDCGNHEFYNVDGHIERCYHCDAGVRVRNEAQG